jgi:hypothetical protein
MRESAFFLHKYELAAHAQRGQILHHFSRSRFFQTKISPRSKHAKS